MNNKRESVLLWYRSSNGSAALEFSLLFIPFVMAFLFLAELCRVVYISSALDLVLAESSYSASLRQSDRDYNAYFKKALNMRLDVWPLFTKENIISTSVKYCDDIAALIENDKHCLSPNAVGKPLALYLVNIHYRPLFFLFPKVMVEQQWKRKVAFVQEFQRGEL
ncbi:MULTISPECIES: TadE/TadG family type IV pilus assembly protein [unclassified Symbiopectobacterium]|uniref:TadE/TadG family type IV pilus assembly protein n=1 Tax=unclassified Symbiopectobacterium TaxID=2794573 RepID=UPI002227F947|nr:MULTISPECIES: TadE family protein [unclassified Symbiopectobacterium]MCW2480012.1 pilus assembly protein [Candidatus Symbiopectobacterium sp. NZEC135]MCW2488859.1 pilus assembly protein [Candidatus Symbiopectobacterium sp. NZEC127]